jgi:hypothetical protein
MLTMKTYASVAGGETMSIWGYSILRPYVVYEQVKDALLVDGSVVVAGASEGEPVETVRALRDDGFDGFSSFGAASGRVK